MTFKDHALDLNYYLSQVLDNKNSLQDEHIKDLCAALNEYLLSDAFTLGIMPKENLNKFASQYSQGLGPNFKNDFSKLLESLPDLWVQEFTLFNTKNQDKKIKFNK